MPYRLLMHPHIVLRGLVRGLLDRRGSAAAPARVLRCDGCGSRAVCPVDWRAEDADGWMVDLRCGECEARWTLWLSNLQTCRLELLVDEQLRDLELAARIAEQARLREQAEIFAEALALDLIGPDDFATPQRAVVL